MARMLRANGNTVVVEGFANNNDGDKMGASLDRANRLRDQLIRAGVSPSQVVAMGKGEAEGRNGGARIVAAKSWTKRRREDDRGRARSECGGGRSSRRSEHRTSNPAAR